MGNRIHAVKSLFVIVLLLVLFAGLNAQPAEVLGKSKAYPNPFRESITIEYQLQQDGEIEVCINNILGQQVISLVKEYQQTGMQRVKWDGKDESGGLVRTGMYYITLRTKTDKTVIKVLKTK